MELFPSAPSMTSASSARVSSPCILESHEHAPAAVLAPEGRAAKGEVDLTDFDHQGGADPADASAARRPHVVLAEREETSAV